MTTMTLVLAALLGVFSTTALAQEAHREVVEFLPGQNSVSIQNTVKTGETWDFAFQANKGQTLLVLLSTDSAKNRFDLYAPGSENPIFVGASSGNKFNSKLAASGEHSVHVYLTPDAAQQTTMAKFSLDIVVADSSPTGAQPAPDFADSLMGGPDYWEVTGVRDGSFLNIRSEATVKADVIAKVPNGTSLRNKGCKLVQNNRWCAVPLPQDSTRQGWVAGRYLREGTGAVPPASN